MRAVAFFTAGFASGMGLMLYSDSWAFRIIGLAVLLCLCFALRSRGTRMQGILIPLAGFVVGVLWLAGYQAHYLSVVAPLDGTVAHCVIRAEDYSRETAYGLALDGTLKFNGKSYRVAAYLDETEEFVPGNTVEGDFRLSLTTDEGENPSSYYPGKGIFLRAYQKGEITRRAGERSLSNFPARLRHGIGQMLDRFLSGDCAAFARALLLGDTSRLSYALDTRLKVTGIRHVAAVSGLHISIFFAIICTVTFRKRYLTAVFGLPLLLLFAAVAGFTPSVNRACIMCGLMVLAQLFSREYDGPTALAFSALVLLVQNPYVISSVSFQLSVASVAGIFAAAPGIQSYFARFLPKGKSRKSRFLQAAASGVSVSLSSQVFTLPLCAYYFGAVSLVGILTNLLVLWIIGPIFWGLIALCLCGSFSSWLAGIVGFLVSVPIRYVLLVVRLLAACPLAAVYTKSPYIVAWLVLVYVLLGLFLLAGKRRPGLYACCCTLGLCAALIAAWWEPLTADVSFTMLDVGQGQCLLLRSGSQVYVVDCGGDSDTKTADIAAETLLSRGFSHVDGLILTHLDRDHAGAAENFLSRIQTGFVILPNTAETLKVPAGTKSVYASRELSIGGEKGILRIFPPVYAADHNEMSLCVLFDTEKCDILITGDRNGFGERSLLRNAEIPEADILVAGHHGAKSSTCQELLEAVRPEIVCISAGEGNPYGHPAPELLKRLTDFGCTVYRTDQNGTITIRR